MADIEVSYENQVIKSLSASGQLVCHTAGKYCDDDITIDYVQPSGGGILNVITGSSIATTICGKYDVTEINVTAGSATSAKQIVMFRTYGLDLSANPGKIKYSGFVNCTAGTTDFYRSPSGITEVDFGGVKLTGSQARMFYGFANNANTTMYIKGLDWSNVTGMTNCFQGTVTYTAYENNGFSVDVEWLGTVNCSTVNLAPNTTFVVPFTHRSLVELMNALGSGGGTCKLGAENLAKLSSAEIAVATAKGWTVTA